MPNITRFNATPSGSGVIITASFDNDTEIQFPTDPASADFMTSLARGLAAANDRIIAAENRASAANRTADRLKKKTGDQQPAGLGQPPQSHAEFLKLVWKAVPGFTVGVERNQETIAIEALRFVPIAVLKAISGYTLPENIPRSEAVSLLEIAGEYMEANGIKSKPYIPSINAAEAAKNRREYESDVNRNIQLQQQLDQHWAQQKANEKDRQKTVDKIMRPYNHY
ncbi:hypothetical protein [Lelliottia amnigena]|uniref:hypothetical protein n=1 Tax=Lelliottia amnigena TaxID=61646 RepID=UPI00405768F7